MKFTIVKSNAHFTGVAPEDGTGVKFFEEKERSDFRLLLLTSDLRLLSSDLCLLTPGWVLESVYQCTREDIFRFLETLMSTSIFTFSEPQAIRKAVYHFKKGGDFADLVIVMQALHHRARKIFSFDKKLQKSFPDYVVEKLGPNDL